MSLTPRPLPTVASVSAVAQNQRSEIAGARAFENAVRRANAQQRAGVPVDNIVQDPTRPLDLNSGAAAITEAGNLQIQSNTTRGGDQLAWDTGVRALGGAAKGVIGLAGLASEVTLAPVTALTALTGHRPLSPMGVASAAMEGVTGLEDRLVSEQSRNAKQLNAEAMDASSEYGREQRETEIADGANRFAAAARELAGNFGRGAAITWTEGTSLADGVSGAAGSLLAGGPLAKGVSIGGRAAVAGAQRLGVTRFAPKTVETLIKSVDSAAFPAVIAGQEGGSVMLETYSRVNEMSPEELASSPLYNYYLEQGASHEEAADGVAQMAGRYAGAVTAPVAALLGKFVEPFAKSPLRLAGSFGTAAGNVGRETVEEAAQEGLGQLAGNTAVRQVADGDQEYFENVGGSAAAGAVYGGLSAGGMQSPGLAIQGTVEGAKLGARGAVAGVKAAAPVVGAGITAAVPVVGSMAKAVAPAVSGPIKALIRKGQERREGLTAEQEARVTEGAVAMASPADIVSDEVVKQAAPESTIDQTEVDSFLSELTMDDEMIASMDPDIQANLGGANTYGEVMVRAAGALDKGLVQDEQGRESSIAYLESQMGNLQNLAERAQSIADQLAEGPMQTRFQDMAAGLKALPSMSVFNRVAEADTEVRAQRQETLSPDIEITTENVESPETQAMVKDTVLLAQRAPGRVAPQAVAQVLKAQQAGTIQLEQQELANLRATDALVQSLTNGEEAAMKLAPTRAVVADIQSNLVPEKDRGLSAVAHARKISREMLVDQDPAKAAASLEDMRRFVEHLNSKVDANNQSFRKWNGKFQDLNVKFQAYDFKERENYESKTYVHPEKESSLVRAQQTGIDARVVTGVYNRLVQAFPELGAQQVKAVDLDPMLRSAPAKELSKQFTKIKPAVRDGKQAPPNQAGQASPAQTARPEPTPAPVAEAEAVVAAPAETTKPEAEAAKPAEQPTPAAYTQEQVDKLLAEQEARMQEKIAEAVAKAMAAQQPKAEEAPAEQQVQEPKVQVEVEKPQVAEAEPEPQVVEETAQVEPETTQVEAKASTRRQELLDFGGKLEGEPLDRLTKNSRLRALFTTDKNTSSRIARKVSPMAFVKNVLTQADGLSELTETEAPISADVRSAYGEFLQYAEERAKQMNARLRAAVDGKGSGPLDLDDPTVFTYVDKRVLSSALDPAQPTDKPSYDTRLAGAAQLATAQIVLREAMRRRPDNVQDMVEATGLPEQVVRENLSELMQSTPAFLLAQDIALETQKILGLTPNGDAQVLETQGLIAALAAEALSTWMAANDDLVTTTKIRTRGKREITLLKVDGKLLPLGSDQVAEMSQGDWGDTTLPSPLLAMPEAIMSAIMEDTAPGNAFYGKAPSASHTIKRSDSALVSDETLQALEKSNKIPFFAAGTRVELFRTLGLEGLNALSGLKTGDDIVRNVNHEGSVRGKLLQNEMSMTALASMIENDRRAQEEGRSKGEVYLGNEINASGRMQKTGPVHPQNNKVLREVFLPGREVELTRGEDDAKFRRSTAQHLGVKVHQMTDGQIRQKLVEFRSAPAIKAAYEVLRTDEFRGDALAKRPANDPSMVKVAELLRDHLGDKATPGALAALFELVQFDQLLSGAKFKTSIYLEADGISNGPGTALAMNAMGDVTADYVTNLEAVGLSMRHPGQAYEKMYSDPSGADRQDFYLRGSKHLTEAVAEHLEQMSPEGKGIAIKTLKLIEAMDPSALSLTIDGDDVSVSFDRGAMKNPMTIFLYGSSIRGIMGNFASNMIDAFYERMSLRLNPADGQTADQAFFPNHDYTPEQAAAAYKAAYADMIEIARGDTTQISDIVINAGARQGMSFEQGLTFTQEAFNNIQSNLMFALGGPLDQALTQALGSAKQGSEVIQKVSQLLNGLARVQMQRLWSKTNKGQLKEMTHDQLKELMANAGRLMLPFMADNQNLQLSKRQMAQQEMVVAQALSQKDGTPVIKVPALLPEISEIGVSAISKLIQGRGDAQMIQAFKMLTDNPHLDVFDGINLLLNNLEADGQKANEAATQAWMSEGIYQPLLRLTESLEDTLLNDEFVDSLTYDEITMVVGPRVKKASARAERLYELIYAVTRQLPYAAETARLRQQAMINLGFTIDQMAGAEAPHVVEGSASFEGQTPADVAAAIQAEMERLRKDGGVAKPAKAADVVNTDDFGTDMGEGLRQGSVAQLATLLSADIGKLPVELRTLAPDLVQYLSGRGYQVKFGSREAIRKDLALQGLNEQAITEANGLTDANGRQIWVVENEASYEVLAHELVHGALSDNLLLGLTDPAAVDPKIADAVDRLEALTQEFLDIKESQAKNLMGTKVAADLIHVQGVVTEALLQGTTLGRWAAINEMTAYVLTNPGAIEAAKRTTVQNPLARLGAKIVALLNRILFPGKAMAVGKDLYSNVKFNAHILMKLPVQQTPYRVASGVLLQHTSSTSSVTDVQLHNLGLRLTKIFNATALKVAKDKGQVAEGVKTENRLKAAYVADTLNHNGFIMSGPERVMFEASMATLMMSGVLDAKSAQRFHQARKAVLENLNDYTDLMEDPSSQDIGDLQEASARFNVLTSVTDLGTDDDGRDLSLPAFVALSMVNPAMRQILENISMTPKQARGRMTANTFMTRVGNTVMDKLSDTILGMGPNPPANVLRAMDAMVKQTLTAAEHGDPELYRRATQASNVMDQLNEKFTDFVSDKVGTVVEQLDRVNDAAKGTKLENHARVTVAAGKLLARGLDKNQDDQVAEEILALSMDGDIPRQFKELFAELVGTTKTTAPVLEMMKITKEMVQKVRQHFRETLPGLLRDKFSIDLQAEDHAALYKGVGTTDLGSMVNARISPDQLTKILSTKANRDAEIQRLKGEVQKEFGKDAAAILKAGDQLADYMVTGKASTFQVRNAYALATGLGVPGMAQNTSPTRQAIAALDAYVSMQAFEGQSERTKSRIERLIRNDVAGVVSTLSYLNGQRKTEMARMDNAALLNHFKGYVLAQRRGEVRMASGQEVVELELQGYTRGDRVKLSGADPLGTTVQYYMHRSDPRPAFQQGIIQNARATAFGIDAGSQAATDGRSAGLLRMEQVDDVMANIARNKSTDGTVLVPVFNEDHELVGFDRLLPDSVLNKYAPRTEDLLASMGQWRGRQVEEGLAVRFNMTTIDRLNQMWDEDGSANPDLYEDLFESEDPVVVDALNAMPRALKDYIKSKSKDGTFMVRSDLVHNVVGYRAPSVGDVFTGLSRLSPELQEGIRDILIGLFGEKAYNNLTRPERVWKNLMSDARVAIVIKSGVVPMANAISNIYQLMSRGVPLHVIVKTMPKMIAQTHAYAESQGRIQKWEAEAFIADGSGQGRRAQALRAKIKAEEDMISRLDIAPLLDKGEFSLVSEGIDYEDLNPQKDRFWDTVSEKVNQLPKPLATATRYAFVTKDTALFKFLARSTAYGDFVAKAVLYEHLTTRAVDPVGKEDALRDVSGEFINYDLLPGRTRSYMEQMGLLWFWNFKLRAIRRAANHIKYNPVQTLITQLLPAPDSVGSLLGDNGLTVIMEGRAGYSVGPGMAKNALGLLPGPAIADQIFG